MTGSTTTSARPGGPASPAALGVSRTLGRTCRGAATFSSGYFDFVIVSAAVAWPSPTQHLLMGRGGRAAARGLLYVGDHGATTEGARAAGDAALIDRGPQPVRSAPASEAWSAAYMRRCPATSPGHHPRHGRLSDSMPHHLRAGRRRWCPLARPRRRGPVSRGGRAHCPDRPDPHGAISGAGLLEEEAHRLAAASRPSASCPGPCRAWPHPRPAARLCPGLVTGSLQRRGGQCCRRRGRSLGPARRGEARQARSRCTAPRAGWASSRASALVKTRPGHPGAGAGMACAGLATTLPAERLLPPAPTLFSRPLPTSATGSASLARRIVAQRGTF